MSISIEESTDLDGSMISFDNDCKTNEFGDSDQAECTQVKFRDAKDGDSEGNIDTISSEDNEDDPELRRRSVAELRYSFEFSRINQTTEQAAVETCPYEVNSNGKVSELKAIFESLKCESTPQKTASSKRTRRSQLISTMIEVFGNSIH
ncbi:hypothetical protein ACOME3_006149 [Neoechinorhynchus agilis]